MPPRDVLAQIGEQLHRAAGGGAAPVGHDRDEVELDIERRGASQVALEQASTLEHSDEQRPVGRGSELAGHVEPELSDPRRDLIGGEENTDVLVHFSQRRDRARLRSAAFSHGAPHGPRGRSASGTSPGRVRIAAPRPPTGPLRRRLEPWVETFVAVRLPVCSRTALHEPGPASRKLRNFPRLGPPQAPSPPPGPPPPRTPPRGPAPAASEARPTPAS